MLTHTWHTVQIGKVIAEVWAKDRLDATECLAWWLRNPVETEYVRNVTTTERV